MRVEEARPAVREREVEVAELARQRPCLEEVGPDLVRLGRVDKDVRESVDVGDGGVRTEPRRLQEEPRAIEAGPRQELESVLHRAEGGLRAIDSAREKAGR